jgi:hypothetical protein
LGAGGLRQLFLDCCEGLSANRNLADLNFRPEIRVARFQASQPAYAQFLGDRGKCVATCRAVAGLDLRRTRLSRGGGSRAPRLGPGASTASGLLPAMPILRQDDTPKRNQLLLSHDSGGQKNELRLRSAGPGALLQGAPCAIHTQRAPPRWFLCHCTAPDGLLRR